MLARTDHAGGAVVRRPRGGQALRPGRRRPDGLRGDRARYVGQLKPGGTGEQRSRVVVRICSTTQAYAGSATRFCVS